MFFDRDEVQIKRQKDRVFREGLEQSSKRVPERQQPSPAYFMEESVRKQDDQLTKKQKYLIELREQYEKEIETKKRRQRQQKERELEEDRKIMRQAEEMARKQREEIEMEKQKKGYKKPEVKEVRETREIKETVQPRVTPLVFLQQPIKILEMTDSAPQAQPNPYQLIRHTSFEPTKYMSIYTEDFRRAKISLEEEAYRMAQLKQKIVSSTRQNFTGIREVKSQGLAELENLNRILQQKQQGYYKLPSQMFDSLDVELATRSRQKTPPAEFSSYYEFNL